MRRYAVRFLVAILTFAIGVTLSLALGLFKPHEVRISSHTFGRRSCPKEFVFVRPAIGTSDQNVDSPLKLVYLGKTSNPSLGSDLRTQVSLENVSGRRITQYALSSERIWQSSEKGGVSFQDWTSDDGLEPGESRTITLPLNVEGLTMRVVQVRFEDGSTWTNLRYIR